jgi:hypothetical protein
MSAMDTSGDASASVYLNGSSALNGNGQPIDGGYLDDDDNQENEMFLEVVRRVEMLEKLKNGLDERETQLKNQLKSKYEDEKVAMKESSEMLVEKEGLRDELIRLKDAREKLIDELQVLKSVDEEMSSFNRVNESFNDALRRHLQLLEEKQAKIYTLKPIITGTHVSCDVDFASRDRVQIHEALVEVLKANIKQTEDQIQQVCIENGIRTTADHNDMLQQERAIKSRIRQLKAKIKDKQREVEKRKRQSSGDRNDQSDDNEDDRSSVRSSSFSRAGKLLAPSSSQGRKRSAGKADEQMECEACHKQYDDVEAFAYHCFRGCSLLEDYMKDKGREISVQCQECDESIGSFVGFTNHLKNVHGWQSPEDPTKKTASSSQSGSKKRSRR